MLRQRSNSYTHGSLGFSRRHCCDVFPFSSEQSLTLLNLGTHHPNTPYQGNCLAATHFDLSLSKLRTLVALECPATMHLEALGLRGEQTVDK